jgi:hypothetical protein
MRKFRTLLVTLLAAAATSTAMAPASANAALDWYYYTYPNSLSSGTQYVDYCCYRADVHALRAWATNGARPRVWMSNSVGTRVSAMGSCETQGCTAGYNWSPGPFPSGWPTVHHHGLGTNPDTFYGQAYDSL